MQVIASPVRREMLRFVWDGERTSTESAELVGLSRPAASQQLKVLREAGLVSVRIVGTRRLYAVRGESLQELRDFLERFWGDKLAGLRQAAETRFARQQAGPGEQRP